MQEKTCTSCGEPKPLDEFNRAKKGKFGREATCRECKRQYYRDNCEHTKKRIRKYKEDNKEQIKHKNKQYRDSDRGQSLSKKYRQEHREELLEYHKEYRKNNLEYFRCKAREYHSRRMKTDSNYRIELRIRNRIRQALKNNSKTSSSMNLLGCTIQEFKNHLQQTAINNGYVDFDIETYSSDNYHIDHIIPCASFDLSDPEQQKECFHYTNQQILTSTINLSKGCKVEN